MDQKCRPVDRGDGVPVDSSSAMEDGDLSPVGRPSMRSMTPWQRPPAGYRFGGTLCKASSGDRFTGHAVIPLWTEESPAYPATAITRRRRPLGIALSPALTPVGRRPPFVRAGARSHPDQRSPCILTAASHADAGGSNGYRIRLWKVELQKLANELKLTHQGLSFTARY
jgi:hypothetical protein